MPLADWIQVAIKAVEEAPDIERGVQVFLQRLHNEMTNGAGLTNPIAVTQAALQAVEDLAIALQSEPSEVDQEESTSPAAGSTSSPDTSTLSAPSASSLSSNSSSPDTSRTDNSGDVTSGGSVSSSSGVSRSIVTSAGRPATSATSNTSSGVAKPASLNPVIADGGRGTATNQTANDNNPDPSTTSAGNGDKD